MGRVIHADLENATIEELRSTAAVAVDELVAALDAAGHGEFCVLRCLEPECDLVHSCDVCSGDDEEVA